MCKDNPCEYITENDCETEKAVENISIDAYARLTIIEDILESRRDSFTKIKLIRVIVKAV